MGNQMKKEAGRACNLPWAGTGKILVQAKN
jgi:hypothetical protein